MAIEEKEKAKSYDLAMERLKPFYERAKKEGTSQQSFYEYIFPDLKKSEDERIRKKLLETIGYFRSRGINQQLCEEFVDYLEKQKEQKPAEWSEQNKKWFDAIIKDYEESLSGDEEHDSAIQIKINLLKSLRPSWKPSEEQMEALKNSAYSALRELYEQLKKL